MAKEEDKKKDIEVITAIYKVNLHCKECGEKIKRHLMITQGVQSVEIEFEKGEIKAKGKIDPLKILKLIEKKSKKKVELISPKVKPKENITTDKKPKEIKDPIIRIISMKVHMHCEKCEADLKSRLIKHKGIFDVKTDMKAQSVTVEGTIEVEKLKSFLRKRGHKNAEVISIKEEKKGKEEGKFSKDDGESTKKKDDNKDKESKPSGESTKKKDDNKDKESKSSGESTKEKKGDAMDNVPYIIHYVYAPQIFSDENPNACSIF
ncbi:hypothetical protein Fmac_028312 [Flemingia macrophylla]|uniref:HMA domain-containing protein n=1 Tax=Flemingia macrophylla TaxID=520843 RepID=A0ABD1L7J4_9FABA